jgi:hypothetical protein
LNPSSKIIFSEHNIDKIDAYFIKCILEQIFQKLNFHQYDFIIRDTYLTYDVIAPK